MMPPEGLFGLDRVGRWSDPLVVRERAVRRGLEDAKERLAEAGGADEASLFRVARYEHALKRIQSIRNIARIAHALAAPAPSSPMTAPTALEASIV
jgi:hypothetical protein